MDAKIRSRAAGAIGVVLALASAAVFSSRGSAQHSGRIPPVEMPLTQQQQLIQSANHEQADGVMSVADYLHLMAIKKQVIASGGIPDSDLAWTLKLLRTRPLTSGQYPAEFRHADVIATLKHLHTIPPPQKEEILEATVPLLSSDDSLDRQQAASLLRVLRDPRSAQYLRPLLNDPNENVRRSVKMALDALP